MNSIEANTTAILLPLPFDYAFDYQISKDNDLKMGEFVLVPFGKREVVGVVWGKANGGIPDKKLRSIIRKIDLPPLKSDFMNFIRWVSEYTLTPLGLVLKLSMSKERVLSALSQPVGYSLTGITPDKMTSARQKVIDVLVNFSPVKMSDLVKKSGASSSVVTGLAKQGVLTLVNLPSESIFYKLSKEPLSIKFSSEQLAVALSFREKVKDKQFSVSLLDGVTGSGKTEVYFDAIEESLNNGTQSLILLPEIGLTPQWLERFKSRFGVLPILWHSDLTNSRRTSVWRDVINGDAKVIIGARSALFLPFPDLGLLIVDEEHDSSFKQEDGVIYNARDMAIVRAQIKQIPVILVSATPSLESVTNVELGRYEGFNLENRHGGAELPSIEIVDLRKNTPEKGFWLAPVVIDAINAALNLGTQSLLFLNRRGYAPLTLCRKCGHRIECPNCQAWLVEHRNKRRLECHYCGHSLPTPNSCPDCQAEHSLVPCGPGVERMAEEAQYHFKDARIAVMSSDTNSKPSCVAKQLKAMEEGKIDILIGTQIVAKGHHFPYLTVVAVVDADHGFSGGDLRASEHTYQLLNQVAGRAGRAEHSGKVFLQTYLPNHPVLSALKSGNRDEFYFQEREGRQLRDLPPFGRLVAIILSGVEGRNVELFSRKFAQAAPRYSGIEVLGPAPAPLSVLRGRKRYRLLVKANRKVNIQEFVRNWLMKIEVPNGIRLQVDVDPISFL